MGLAVMACLVAGCDSLTLDQRRFVGLTAGAATGLITAEALGSDANWRVIATLGGAAAGTLVAQNSAVGRCAYARGDGTYFVAACP